MGQLTEVAYPDGNEALYDYSRGVVKDVRVKIGGATSYAATGVSYRPMDLAMSGWTSHNGLANTIGYDSSLRPTSITVAGVESLAFTYDAANRITTITNGLDSSHSENLGYDALGRLTSMSSSARTESYSYDADGNRTHQVINGTATSFTYASGSNRLMSTTGGLAASYGYNADGDTIDIDGHRAYRYASFDRLVSAGGMDYVISAEGQRLEKTGAAGTTYFAPGPGGALLAEYDSGTWVDHVWLNGRLVSLVKSGGVHSVHDDQTGRPIAITAPGSPAIEWAAEGLPFNRTVTTNSFGDFNVGFPGQYRDGETGLWHNGYRDYDASLGRYIESDPIGLAGGINTYAYVGNNPVSRIDPWGLQAWTPGTLPPPNIPGGPWTPAGPGQLPGDFYGPKKPTGPKDMCRYVPDENNGGTPGAKKPYWKVLRNGEDWQRYNLEGDPIPPEVAHPGDPLEQMRPTEEPLPVISPWLIGLYLLFYSKPAY